VGRAARARQAREARGVDGPGRPTYRYDPAEHDHRLRSCRACQRREDHVAFLAHRVRQQGEQIVRLHEILDRPAQARPPAFTFPAQDDRLAGRRP
jgi:hypothetical protein